MNDTPNHQYEPETVLNAEKWLPEKGESRDFELLSFQPFESTVEGRKSEFIIYQCADLKTGEVFTFVPGALFDFLMTKYRIENGHFLRVKYLGKVTLDNGYQANQWSMVKLRQVDPAKGG